MKNTTRFTCYTSSRLFSFQSLTKSQIFLLVLLFSCSVPFLTHSHNESYVYILFVFFQQQNFGDVPPFAFIHLK